MATRPLVELTEEMMRKAAEAGWSYAMTGRRLNFIQDRLRTRCQYAHPEIHAIFVENGKRRMREAGSKTCDDRRERSENGKY